jgi:predicted transcriptional regulator
MIPILPLLDPLARLAAAAMEHVNIRKAGLSSRDKEAQAQRLKELEDSDLEQARMISELSESVEQLARAMQSQIEETSARERRLRGLLYLAMIVSLASLTICLLTFFKLNPH